MLCLVDNIATSFDGDLDSLGANVIWLSLWSCQNQHNVVSETRFIENYLKKVSSIIDNKSSTHPTIAFPILRRGELQGHTQKSKNIKANGNKNQKM
jgi:hypothetical protein